MPIFKSFLFIVIATDIYARFIYLNIEIEVKLFECFLKDLFDIPVDDPLDVLATLVDEDGHAD